MKYFFLVLARNKEGVTEKIKELQNLGIPFVIVCGEEINHPNIIYREPKGKFDAINYGFDFIPKDTDVIVFNDVDTTIHNFDLALKNFEITTSMSFCRNVIKDGPQRWFNKLLDFLRRGIVISANGELMLVRYSVLEKILPLKPCKAEDTLILYSVLSFKGNVSYCEDCYVETKRTITDSQEIKYKRRTTGGLYQAAHISPPPTLTRFFFVALPFISPVLLILGQHGYAWTKGILLGYSDYLHGDRSGAFRKIN